MKRYCAFVIFVFTYIYGYDLRAQCGGLTTGTNSAGPYVVTGNCTLTGDIVRIRAQVTVQNGASLTIGTVGSTQNLRLDNVASNLIIQNGGSLTVTRNLQLRNTSATVTIDAGGTATVNNNFVGQNNAGVGGTLTVNGSLSVTGTTRTFNNVTIGPSATFTTGGNWVAQTGTLDISGDVDVTGNFNAFTDNPTLTIQTGGNLTAGGQLDIDTDQPTNISGVLKGNSSARLSQNFNILAGGILQVGTFLEGVNFDVQSGGTLSVTNNPGAISTNATGTVTVNGGNGDLDCSNGCCGAQCNAGGNNLDENANNQVLPIELGHFEGQVEGNLINLSWSSVSEKNNHFYTLEKSIDGENFEVLDYIAGAGDSQEARYYNYADHDVYHYGLYHYRLSQTDYDGTSELLRVIWVQYTGDGSVSPVLVYPTVLFSSETISVSVGQGSIQHGEVILYNLSGAIRERKKIEHSTAEVRFPSKDLPPAIYVLAGQINGIPFSKKLIVK